MKQLAIILFVLVSSIMSAQRDVTTLGIQFKPMIPSKFFDTGTETQSNDYLTVDYVPQLGMNFGMVIRQGFTDMFSLETGINMVRRVFTLEAHDSSFDHSMSLKYRLTGYEVPVQGLVYVQLGNQMWMNASGGLSFDFYPSNLFSSENSAVDTIAFDLEQRTFRNTWIQIALTANYGFEYRTKDAGYFYVGASYHRPFDDIAITRATWIRENVPLSVENALSGSYLTLDLRYFFHEDPERKRLTRPNRGS